ncbi:MAG: DUF4440 domain-containing protein [Acidimicrobiales bacterium]
MSHADWRREVDELHQFFEDWFHGRPASIDRFVSVLADEFEMIDPRGGRHDRATIIAMIEHARGSEDSVRIRVSDHQLVAASGEVLVGRYVEHHEDSSDPSRRVSTVVFELSAAAPNGVRWRSVHETFL